MIIHTKHSFSFLLFLTFIALGACTPEYKMAKAYIASRPDVSIMVLPTNVVFKDNLKTIEGVDTNTMTQIEVDSIRMDKSTLLKQISDSIFLENFTNSLYSEFDELGFTVFTQAQSDSFLFLKTPSYIFNIAQIQLEEMNKVHEDKEQIGDKVYYKDTNLNALSFNFWFELSALDNTKDKPKLFFVSETIRDLMDGYFKENVLTGEVDYRFNINRLDSSIVYKYCRILGQRYAGYTFDFIMNKYIDAHWPANKKRRFYMQYKRYYHTLEPTRNNKFIIMDEE